MADNVVNNWLNKLKNAVERHKRNNRVSPYLKLSIQERIDRAMYDQSFIDFCVEECRRDSFNTNFEIAEKIAQIDISGIKIDGNLLDNQNLFSKKQIMADMEEFYQTIDRLDPNGINLMERLNFSKKYFTLRKGSHGRSYCKSGVDKHGNINREIYVEIEGRINDTISAVHEAGHSLMYEFQNAKRVKDNRVEEIPTLIVEQLATIFLMEKYPQYTENFLENDRFGLFFSVKKARESLMDALIVKVVSGDMGFEEAVKKYGHLFNGFPRMLSAKLEQIETYNFYPMFEFKYLIPEAISWELREKYQENPQLVVRQLKYIIKESGTIMEEEVFAYLGLPNKKELTKQYINKFHNRMDELVKAQLKTRQNKELLQGENYGK